MSTLKALKTLIAVSDRSTLELLKGLSRAERKRLTTEVIRANNPKISNTLLKNMIRSGQYPSRYSNSAINASLVMSVKDAVGATLSFSGSALSGTVNGYVVGVYENID